MKSKGAKSLLTINNTTLLDNQLKTIWKMYPGAEIIVVIGFQANKIRSMFRGTYPVRFVFNPNYETSNVMYSIALALEVSLSKSILILHDDLLFNNNAIADMVGTTSKILVLPENHLVDEQEVGVAIHNNIVTNLSYGLHRNWGQMAYITGKELVTFEKIAFNHELSANWFLYEGLNKVINSNGSFVAHSPTGIHWLEIDSVEDLEMVKGMII